MSSRKTYDTDIITLRRIFAVTPGTNAPIPSGNILATTSHGEAAYVNPYSIPGISQLSTALVSLPSTISTSVAAIGGVSQLLAGSGISLSPTNGIGVVTLTATGGGGSVTTANLTSTVIGLGTAGYISSAIGVAAIPGGLVSTANLTGHISTANLANFVSSSYLATQLGSTVIGLGSAGYFSTIPRSIQTQSISTGNIFTSSVILVDTTIGFGYTGFPNQLIVSSGNLLLNNASISGGGGGGGAVSQVVGGTNITISPPGGTGIVTINGASFPSLGGLVSTANLVNYVSTANLTNFISTANLANFISTANLANFVSTSYLATQLASTVIGLGSAGYLSTGYSTLVASSFTSSNASFQNLITSSINFGTGSGYLTLPNTIIPYLSVGILNVSTLLGYTPGGTVAIGGVVSTANLANLVSTSYLATQLASTVIGLGTAGYISSAVATIPGGLVSTANLANLVSTANLANLVSTSYLATQLTSTVIGLGSMGYLSTIEWGSVVSTANLANMVSTSYLLNGIEFSSLSNETARFNFSSMFVNNTPILFDQYGNLSLSFQTL